MRTALAVLIVALLSVSALAQRPPRGPRPSPRAMAAESAVKQAINQLVEEKKALEQDLQVLGHIRAADGALTDPMQPAVAVQKALEHIVDAERLNSDFLLRDGLIRSRQALEDARRSPGAADFERLRSLLRTQALGPSSRLVVRRATALQEETLAWIRVQELIAGHLRLLSEITGESLRAAQQEN